MVLIPFAVLALKGLLSFIGIPSALPVLDIKNFASLENVKCNMRLLCTWLSNWSSTVFVENNCFFLPSGYSFVKDKFDCMSMGLFLSSLFCSIGLCVFSLTTTMLLILAAL